MKKKLAKVGNSRVLRIPDWMCHHYDLKEGTDVYVWDNVSPDKQDVIISFKTIKDSGDTSYMAYKQIIQATIDDEYDKRHKLGAYAKGSKRRPRDV